MVTCLICDEGRIKAVGFKHRIKPKVVYSLKYLKTSSLSTLWYLLAIAYSSPQHYITPYALFLFYDTHWYASTY